MLVLPPATPWTMARVRVRMNPFGIDYAGRETKGPFHSILGTLMSIPLCIALALVRGAPTMAAMTSYHENEVY